MRKDTKVASTEFHFPDDKIKFQVNFWVADGNHFPENFKVCNNSFQRRVVITGQKDLSDSLENEERFFGSEILLVKKAKDLVHSLTV
jgi:hypothetical protein